MAKTKSGQPSFQHFLEFFPAVELPFTLGEDTHHLFSKENDPLPPAAIGAYIMPIEGEQEEDAMTEYIACFQLPTNDKFHAIVYWRAGLLNYQYRLVTFDTKGNLIAEKVIAGTTYDGTDLTQTMAVIQDNLLIYLVSGQSQVVVEDYAAANSTANRLQISDEGKIVEL
ncbi:MAG: hypothetical protein AAFZ63_26820 [Bacteroidota bacterium]